MNSNINVCTMAALSSAIKSKRFRQAKILIEMGIDVNARDSSKRTPLMELCFLEEEAKAAKLARLLLDNGSRVGIKDADGMTALCHAAKLGREQLVSAMMEEIHSFDPNAADRHGNTALHYSAMSGNFVVLNLLLKTLNRYKLSVDKPNKSGETPLICAAKSGNFLCARILVSEGKASQNARDKVFFKTANEWERTKESLRSASKSPLFRSLQLPTRGGSSSRSDSDTEDKEEVLLNTRPYTAPESGKTVSTREKNHRELLRRLFRYYEGQVSSTFRPGAKPKPVVIEPPSSPSETMSQDSEFSEFGDSFPSRTNSPGGLLGRRMSVNKALNLSANSNHAFRRRSIAVMGLGTPNTGRRLSVSSGASGRSSSQSMAPPKIRRGSINVIGKLSMKSQEDAPKLRRGSINVIGKMNLNLQAAKRDSVEKVSLKSRRSSVDMRSKALPSTPEDGSNSNTLQPQVPALARISGNRRNKTPSKSSFGNLQTLAESDGEEEEEEEEEILQRSSPAALMMNG